ncbi:MAG: glycogen-binding domain-containing protein [Spirochaetaceae bacterium]|jgi:hypothetical protein|nr:glycogen-binding domain-containing protein [Spirochaetaceae bacterium]
MKTKYAILLPLSLIFIIGRIYALDTTSVQFVDFMLGLDSPAAPRFYGDSVVFTSPSLNGRKQSVGVVFAHEGFAKIHYFEKLMIPTDTPAEVRAENKKAPAVTYSDSGILFYAWEIEPGIEELDYRLVIDGLYSNDKLNPNAKRLSSGLLVSTVSIPEIAQELVSKPNPARDAPGALSLVYKAEPGDTVYVAGSFNNWDPFMYKLKETSPGYFTLKIPLPPDTYQYAFYYKGKRVADPYNLNWVYTAQGEALAQVEIR